MSVSLAEIKAIMLCGKGTLSTTPNNPIYIGNRASGGKFTIEDTEMISDYKEREHRNKLNIKSEFTSLQIGIEELNLLLGHIKTNMGADVQVVSTLDTGNTSTEGIFNLAGDNFQGIDFELARSNTEASTKLTLESSYDYYIAKSIIAAASTNVANSGMLATTGKNGTDFAKMLQPNLDKIVLGQAVSEVYPLLVPKNEVKSWKFTLKTKGEKNLYNQTMINALSLELECEILNASVSKISALLDKDQNSRIGFDIIRKDSTWESWIINLMPFKVLADKNDKTSTVKVSTKGLVSLSDIVINTTGSAKIVTIN